MGKFDKYGCAPRSLVEAARREGLEVSDDKFHDQFQSRFPDWKKLDADGDPMCGVVGSVNDLKDPAKGIGLAVVGESSDYDAVRAAKKAGNEVLIESRKFSGPGEPPRDNSNHSALIERITDAEFDVYHPDGDGTFLVLGPYKRAQWDSMKCRGVFVKKAK